MITDGEPQGEPEDLIRQAEQRIKDDEANKRVAFFAVGVENANMDRLRNIAVRAPVKLVGLNFVEMFVWLSQTDAFELVQTALKDEASMREVPVRDLATTLILMIVTPNFAAAAQVGDGAVVIGDTEGGFVTLTKPQSGEYVNQTNFITSSDALSALQINVWQGDVAQVSGFSDGIQMLSLKLPDYIPYKPFFLPLFQAMRDSADEASANEQLIEFLNSSRIAERTDYDLTLLLAVLIE